MDPSVSLNKIGHALHELNPVFRRVSLSEKVKECAFQLGLLDPVIVQSMYIFKNPGIGSEGLFLQKYVLMVVIIKRPKKLFLLKKIHIKLKFRYFNSLRLFFVKIEVSEHIFESMVKMIVSIVVIPHQDSWYLYTEPMNLVGYWFALDDATLENGCLWFAKGSHKGGTHRRYVRNPDKESEELLIYTGPEPFYQKSNFAPAPVPKGTVQYFPN